VLWEREEIRKGLAMRHAKDLSVLGSSEKVTLKSHSLNRGGKGEGSVIHLERVGSEGRTTISLGREKGGRKTDNKTQAISK